VLSLWKAQCTVLVVVVVVVVVAVAVLMTSVHKQYSFGSQLDTHSFADCRWGDKSSFGDIALVLSFEWWCIEADMLPFVDIEPFCNIGDNMCSELLFVFGLDSQLESAHSVLVMVER